MIDAGPRGIFLFSLIIIFGGASEFVLAQETAAERQTSLPTIEVFGTGVESLGQALEPSRINAKKIEQSQYTDVHRALKNSSGVYMREEDGQGLRPNIGLRGTNPDRSKKIVLRQDGILIGPAPYSAPAAYYTPSMNHTERLEVHKGFAAVPYGPNSIGGSVNYISTAIPLETRRELKGHYGSFNTYNLKVGSGGPVGGNGYLLEGSHRASDGFKKLDGGGDTGFKQYEILGKWEWKLSERLNLLFTGGFSNEESKETYLGLSRDDFAASPFRRYAASAEDDMKWNHSLAQARLNLQLDANSTQETTLYRHDFQRTWYRLDRFRDSTVNLRNILNDPTGANANYYNILRGTADSSTLGTNGELVVARNDRTYFSHGVETKWLGDYQSGRHKHSLELGLRWHQDSIARNHKSDLFEMTSGQMVRTAAATQIDTKNRDSATAITVTALDNWRMGTWTLTPVARLENIRFEFKDELTGTMGSRSDSFWAPGFAVSKTFAEKFALRLSGNDASTAAGLSSTGSEQRERAFNSEIEFSYKDPVRNQEFQVIYFVNDYQNLTGTCTVSSGCTTATDSQFNGGKALIQGYEVAAAKGFSVGPVYIPIQANVTLLSAEFSSTFVSDSPEWGVGTVRSGDPLPYVPTSQYSLSVGTEYGRYKQDITFVHQSKVFDQSASAGRQEIAPFGIVDWAGEYSLSKKSRLLAKVDNILGREYAVAARPFGLRPGKPQSFQVGWVYRF